MKYLPHAYQRAVIRYLETHAIAAVFLDMGLGKTSIALTAFAHLLAAGTVRKCLVVAPLRVAKTTWPDELRKWDHLASLTCAVAVGTAAERAAALAADAAITIVNRENLPWLVRHLRGAWPYDMVILDELSSFKSPYAKRTRALLAVRPRIRRVVGLTGTPSPNGLLDLYSEFRVLDGGARLGTSLVRYERAFFRPDKQWGSRVFSWRPLPGAAARIYEKIADITISLRAADHLAMPALVTTETRVTLSENERALYEKLRRDLIVALPRPAANPAHPPGGAGPAADPAAPRRPGPGLVTAANAAVLAGKLAQLASGAIYSDDGTVLPVHDRKLDALEDLIESRNGRPLLVAYWFRHERTRLAARLAARHILYDDLETAASLARWNRGETPVGLLHPARAGHGLNLQHGGSTLVWFTLPWSLELYQQTNARLYRQGQTHTVVITHLIAAHTIDEHILAALRRKDETQAALIAAVEAELA